MAEWTYKLDIDMLERKGTSACLAATRAMIARIRELEAELERASQPGGGELDLPGLRVAIRAFTPHMHDWISKVIDALERQPGSGEDTARLDWLQTHGCTVRRADNGKRNLVIWNDGSIREAIDAARASLDGRS